jgi:hypothetical protein
LPQSKLSCNLTLTAIQAATVAEIAALPGFNQKLAENLQKWLAGEKEAT